MSLHLPEILDLLFICIPGGAEESLAGRSHIQFQGILCRFDHFIAKTFSSERLETKTQMNGTKAAPNSVPVSVVNINNLLHHPVSR